MKWFHYILVLSAIIPATFLLAFSTLLLVSVLSNGMGDSKGIQLLFTSLLGIIGYFGLLLITFGISEKRPKLVISFLLAGILSFVWFTSINGYRAWNWILSMQEPGEWFLYTWPALISIFFVARIGRKLMLT